MTAVRTHAAARSRGGELTGVGTLVRFALRRDRVRLPVWILGLAVAIVATAVSFPDLYPTAEDRAGLLGVIANPGTTALIGAVYGDGDYTYGIMIGHQLLAMTAVVAALMSIFTVVRHTRAEEETGRAELVRSAVVGRHAGAAAAVLVVVGANVVLALALAGGLGALGIETVTWEGSLLFGAAVGAVGLVFAGVAAITAQLTESARAASSIAGLVLAAAYVLRAIGDVAGNGLSWASPIGWIQAAEVYHADDWAVLAWPVLAIVVLLAIAVPLGRRRDLGAGLLSSRPGPAEAGAGLRGPVGLAWRLNRGVVIGWGVGLLAFGLMYGPVLSQADDFLDDLPIMAEFLPDLNAGGAELFGSLVIAICAILATVPVVQVVLRLRTEETAGRVGPLLATPLSRVRWAGATVLVAAATAAVTLVLAGLGIGAGAAWSMLDAAWLGRSIEAALAYFPAALVALAVALALVGVVPRAAGAAWAVVTYAVVIMYFGGLLDLPQWAQNLSPFAHVPQQPAAEYSAEPMVWLTLVAVVGVGIGLAGIRRRDLREG